MNDLKRELLVEALKGEEERVDSFCYPEYRHLHLGGPLQPIPLLANAAIASLSVRDDERVQFYKVPHYLLAVVIRERCMSASFGVGGTSLPY